jgi:hypothetical protein
VRDNFRTDLRAQLHQLFLEELFLQTRIQIVRDIRGRISHRVSQLDDSLRPAFLPTAELTSIQKGHPTRAAPRTFPN